jgi:hypothetical protein
VTSYANEYLLASGMTLRDYFAAQALSGIAPLPWSFSGPEEEKHKTYVADTASSAYAIADAMLAEREKKP